MGYSILSLILVQPSGVGFKLKLGDSEINDNSMYDVSNLPGAVTTDDNGVYTMHFSAQYARIDAATPVTAGDVRSVLTIAVSAGKYLCRRFAGNYCAKGVVL